MLSPAHTSLISAATTLIASLPPNDNHSVASAALTSHSRVFTGVNLYHFTGGPCAELVVLGIAAGAGVLSNKEFEDGGGGRVWTGTREEEERVVAIVAVGSEGRGVISPCGRCTQVLVDYWPKAKIIVKGPSGELEAVGVDKLLPYAYVWKDNK